MAGSETAEDGFDAVVAERLAKGYTRTSLSPALLSPPPSRLSSPLLSLPLSHLPLCPPPPSFSSLCPLHPPPRSHSLSHSYFRPCFFFWHAQSETYTGQPNSRQQPATNAGGARRDNSAPLQHRTHAVSPAVQTPTAATCLTRGHPGGPTQPHWMRPHPKGRRSGQTTSSSPLTPHTHGPRFAPSPTRFP